MSWYPRIHVAGKAIICGSNYRLNARFIRFNPRSIHHVEKCPGTPIYLTTGCPNKSPPPRQKFGIGANFWCKSPGVRGREKVMNEIGTCISFYKSVVSLRAQLKDYYNFAAMSQRNFYIHV